MIRFRKILPALVLAAAAASCSVPGGRPLRPSADTIIARALAGDDDFLKNADLSFFDAAALIRRKPGSAYYLARRFGELDMPAEAEFLLQRTFDGDADPWRKEAGRELAVLLDREGGETEMLALSRRYRVLYPDDPEGRVFLLAALFRCEMHEDLVREAGDAAAAEPRELFLLARAQQKLGRPEWKDAVRKLFRDHPAEGVHIQAREIFAGETRPAFPAAETAFFRAKAARAAGAWAAARPGYKNAPAAYRHGAVFLREYGEILQKTGGHRDAAREFEKMLPGLRGEALLAAREQLGRLYRLAGRYDRSVRVLNEALRQREETDGFGDRIIWYILSSSLRVSPDAMLREFALHAPKIRDPGYFSDLFETLGADLVRRGLWRRLAGAYEATKEAAAPEDNARFAFLLAAAIRGGLYRPPGGSPTVRELLETAHARGGPYHSLLAGIALGRPFPPPDKEGPAGAPADQNEETSPGDIFVRGFVEFGLSRAGVAAAGGRIDGLRLGTAAALAEMEAARGRHIDGLRLLSRTVRRSGRVPDRKTLEILYPAAFRREMDAVISEFSLSPALFYGLVREESHFEPSIRSHAGAVGLSQLMPSTARDVARKLRIEKPELTDPATNLRIGGRYLKDLEKRFNAGVYALAGYNAGGGRVSRWRKQLRGLSGVLFAEAVPFVETRDYIRKVLVSAVHYGYLYGGKSPGETAAEIFPDFAALPGGENP